MSVIHFTDANFEAEVLKAEHPVLVDFRASWCGPCRMMTPVIEAAADKYAGKAKIGKLNVDENPKASRDFGVSAIPTMILFKGGKEADRAVGFMPAENLDKFLAPHLAS